MAGIPEVRRSKIPMRPAHILRTVRHVLGRGAALLWLMAAASLAQAATATISIGFDTDNDPATGCLLSVGSQSMPGVERVLETVTTTGSAATVGAVTLRVCVGAVLGAPVLISTGGWSIGLGAGTAGADVIETFIPLAELTGASAVRVGAITATDSIIGLIILSLPPPAAANPAPIPTLSPWALLTLALGIGVSAWLLRRHARDGGRALLMLCLLAVTLTTASVWAIVRDGNPADWTGIAPVAVAPAGDAPAGQDLVALFAVVDGANLALRIDALLEPGTGENQPPAVSAGSPQVLTLAPPATTIDVTLIGSASDDGLPKPPGALMLTWSKVSGAGSVVFSSPSNVATQATLGGAGAYVLRLTASDGALSTSSDVLITVNTPTNAAPSVNAGPPQNVTLVPPATSIDVSLTGSASDDGLPDPPGALTLLWSKVSGPGSAVFADAAAAATQVTLGTAGTYVLRLTASDGGLSASSDVQIVVAAPPLNTAPLVTAGPAQTVTLTPPATSVDVTLAGTASDDGLPNPPGALTLLWTKVSGPGSVVFANAATAASQVTLGGAGVYVLRLTANDGALTATASVTITVIAAGGGNQPPTVNAGASQTITLPSTAALVGTASDDGLPNPPGALTLTWSKFSGPGSVAFSSPSTLATQATFGAAGVYVLRLTASDGALSASSDVQITVAAAPIGNTAPLVVAGPAQTVTITPPATSALVTLAGSASDDGLPNPPGALTLLWTKVSGPGTAVFANAAAAATQVTLGGTGVYVLRLTASDGALSSSANVTITVNLGGGGGGGNQPPTVNAGVNQSITLPSTALLVGTASDDGLPNPPGALTLTWSKFSGPGSVVFSSPSTLATQATFGAAGVYVLRLTASDGALSASSDVQITVAAAPIGNTAPLVVAGPAQTVTITPPATSALVTLAGSASDDGLPNPPGALTLLWTKVSGPGTAVFANAAAAATQVTLGGTGVYVLRLTASDGALSSSANVTITVNLGGGGGGTNLPPTVNAGANQTITLPATATLAGTASDDGLPNPPGTLGTTWSFDAGPGTGVGFANPGALATTATFWAAGTYVLRLTANDGATSASSTVQVTVLDGPPVIAPIADQTIELGARFQVLLLASDSNAADTLTYALLNAPTGAALAPAPLIDWTPTAAQLGANAFTARVTDGSGQSATVSFMVTVVHTNHAPQLATQFDQWLVVGEPFSRTLAASDPDVGDVLTFTLVSGPTGMTLSGNSLSWPTTGRTPGDYAVTVRVSDAGGLTDTKSFTINLRQVVSPVAVDDNYVVRIGQTLNVPAPGVLGNDDYAGASTLIATKLTDPALGTLAALNGDGSFSYQAPATLPGDPFTVAKLWTTGVEFARYHELVADLNADGNPDVIGFSHGTIRARSGLDGSPLWNMDNTGATDCELSPGGGPMEHRVLADIDDSGRPSLVQSTKCAREGSAWHDNIVAYDHLGKVKWVSPPLSKPHPDIRRGATPVPPGGFTPGGLAYGRGLSVARLTAGGPPVLLMRAEIPRNNGVTNYTDAAGVVRYADCRAVTGLIADENIACRATFIISGTDGSVLQTLVVRNPAAVKHFGGPGALSEMPPIAMDIDGDGRVDLVSGTEVWMQNASGGFDFAWQLPQGVNDTAVADFDGDGKAEIVHLRSNGESNENNRGIFIYSHDGTFKRRIPLQAYWFTPLTIADVDGDGRSDVVLGADGFVYAFRDDGRPLWAYKVPPDVPDNPVFAPFYTQPVQSFQVGNAPPQVYDLDGDGVAEVVFSGYSRIMILDGRTGLRKVEPYWTYSFSYNDVGALMLVDMNNDGHVDILQNAAFVFNCGFVGADFATECNNLLGPTVLKGGGSNNWLPGPKAFPNVQYRSTAIDSNARVLHDTKVSRVFRTPEQQGTVRDPRLAQGTSFTYQASNGPATSAPATVFLQIVPNNRPPEFTSQPPKSLLQAFAPNPPGGLVTHYYDLTAIDPDAGDTVSFSLKSAPTWVTMSGPARIRFEPTCGSYGYPCPWGWTTVIVTATDSFGASTDQVFIVNLTTTPVTVPSVVGMSFDAAQAALVAQSLQGVIWVEAFSAQPVGTVLAQDPLAGAVVGQFDDIRLTVSKGLAPVLMPYVVGQPLATANGLLTSAGLTVNVTTTFSTTIPAGEITAQSPAAGTELIPATAPPVQLTVSAGGPLPSPVASIVLEPGPGPLARLAGDELQFKAVAILADGTSADVSVTAVWSTTNATAATVNLAGFVAAKAGGTATIAATLAGKSGQVTLNVAPLVPGDNTPPTATITSPAEGADVTGPTPIVGTASDANFLRYELAYALADDDNFTLITEGTSPVTGGTLATFDPTVLLNDLYTLRLTVFDKNGNETVATRLVQVRGDRKVGLFSLTFQDLNVPASGIPLTIHRTYDSRDKAKGDFGIGWRLGLQTLRLRTNRVLGTGWVRVVSGPTVTLLPTSEHRVSVAMPDGRVEMFDMIVSPTSNLGSLGFTNVTGYQPRAGTLGKLEALGNNSLLIVSGGAEDELVDDYSLDTYSPKLYRYTMLDGTQIEISPTAGVKKVTDPNGNAVTFGPGGILHSDGRGIVFTRDAKERIVAITDLLGNVQTYAYDGNGDLVSHTDAMGGISRYAYDQRHGLIDIRNALGTRVTRNEYDAAGRLIAMTDATGKQITYSHNDAANEDLVTDRLGNQTRVQYDATGNIVRKEASVTIEGVLVNAVTTATYDAMGNETTTVDPDGRKSAATYSGILPLTSVRDPEGFNLATSFAYNARNDLTQATDAAGRSFTFSYDSNGNPIGANLPNAGSVSVVNDAPGRSDRLPGRSRYAYGIDPRRRRSHHARRSFRFGNGSAAPDRHDLGRQRQQEKRNASSHD